MNLFGFEYGGFYLDDTIFQNDSVHQKTLRATFQKQVEVVNSIEFSPTLSNFLHQLFITAVIAYNPASSGKKDYAFIGRYIPRTTIFGGAYITLNAAICGDPAHNFANYDTLLHECMHAIHDIYVPGRSMNPQIIAFYNHAKANYCYGYYDDLKSCSDLYSKQPYPHQEYLFSNVNEFFACTATTFLSGKSHRHPFSREEIQEQQPEYYAFLQKFFGPDSNLEDSAFSSINNWYQAENYIY
ncbi:MAG: hypothetical protein FJ390_05985 [Verrucomicrobia bacterium]|nr:hypothetical protein [Verrucomicrobiota bacterium]